MRKKIGFYGNALFFGLHGILMVFLYAFFILALFRLPLLSALIFFLLVCIIHAFFAAVVIARLWCLREESGLFAFVSAGAAFVFFDDVKCLRFLRERRFKQNVPAKAVAILAYPDWSYMEAWARSQVSFGQLKAVCNLMEAREGDFAIYTMVSEDEVRKIMADKAIQTVYFVGHGARSLFGLSNGVNINYADFTMDAHPKLFVHQIHCGHDDGPRLIDLVVPEENREECIFFDGAAKTDALIKELERRTRSSAPAHTPVRQSALPLTPESQP